MNGSDIMRKGTYARCVAVALSLVLAFAACFNMGGLHKGQRGEGPS